MKIIFGYPWDMYHIFTFIQNIIIFNSNNYLKITNGNLNYIRLHSDNDKNKGCLTNLHDKNIIITM